MAGAAIDGEILAVDHSFKVAKQIKIYDSHKKPFIQVFIATLTVYNEFHQVSDQYLSLKELRRNSEQIAVDFKEI